MTGETFVLGLLTLLTIVASVVLWNVFATARTKIKATRHAAEGSHVAGSDEYRRLAERAVDAQERTFHLLAELAQRLDADSEQQPSSRA